MHRDGFYIIRCPYCGRYTYAPIRQKTRLCVYCQRIFKINPLNVVYIEDAKTARAYVKQYQTGKHHQEFMDAVEKSRNKIQALIPKERVELEQLQEARPNQQPASNRRRDLERILYKYARNRETDLHVLEEECEKEGIPWDWAVHQIEMLIRSGHIIAPKPWQVRLIVNNIPSDEQTGQTISPTKLAREISEIIRQSKEPLSYSDILEQLKQYSVLNFDLEEALTLLQLQGYILKTAKGTFKWSAD